ncbi:MAG: Ig-like domain-containing protein [Janthinobacterium lividum]
MFQLLRAAALLLPLLLGACAGLARDDQGRLQPQTVRGPCTAKKFFLLGFISVDASLAVENAGGACTLTILNPALQVVLNAALVTTPPAHGIATAALITLGRQAAVSYTPQPGYTGPDSFSVTLEPDAIGITFAVTVQPAGTLHIPPDPAPRNPA